MEGIIFISLEDFLEYFRTTNICYDAPNVTTKDPQYLSQLDHDFEP